MDHMPKWNDAVANKVDGMAQGDRYNSLAQACDKGCDRLGIADSIECRIACMHLVDLADWYFKNADALNEAIGPDRVHDFPPGQKSSDDLYMDTYQKFAAAGPAAARDEQQAIADQASQSGWTPSLRARGWAVDDVVNKRPMNPPFYGPGTTPADNEQPMT